MSEVRNLGNAIVIVACIYFLINVDFGLLAKIGIGLILFFSIITWGIYTNPYQKQNNELLEAQIKVEEAKRLNLNVGSQLMTIQSKLFARGLRN